MSSVLDYMQLCRLCLVKDKVNVPIFGESSDVGQIFFKITACLPIKVSQNDNLPKKICDTCLYKVDLLYQFWNTTVNAEKQLLQWLGEIGVEVNLKKSEQSSANHTNQHSIQDEPLVLKEERNEADAPSADAVQQPFTSSKPVAFKSYDQLNETNIKAADIREDAVEETSLSSSTNVQLKPEVSEKRLRSRTAAIKKEEIHIKTTSTNNNSSADEPMDEDSSEKLISQEESDSSMDAGERIAKEEAESEEEYEDTAESLEPTAFVGVPSDSACDTDQPGPSGLNKPVTSTDTGISNPLRIHIWKEHFMSQEIFIDRAITTERGQEILEDKLLCSICDKVFDSNHKYVNHMYGHKEKRYTCDVCSKPFYFQSQLESHRKLHDGERSFKCSYCEKSYVKKQDLQVHELQHVGFRPFKCENCEKSFYKKIELSKHVKIDHEGVRYICFPCNKSLKDFSYYSQHMKTHDPDFIRQEYRCPDCDKMYESIISFRVHKLSHDGKEHKCDECGKTTSSKYSLAEHKRVHTGYKPHVCEQCGRAFANKSVLGKHERTHTKERPYSCTHCDKKFTQRSSMVVHIRYHTGERPHKCESCEKGFVTRTLLKNHIKSHDIVSN